MQLFEHKFHIDRFIIQRNVLRTSKYKGHIGKVLCLQVFLMGNLIGFQCGNLTLGTGCRNVSGFYSTVAAIRVGNVGCIERDSDLVIIRVVVRRNRKGAAPKWVRPLFLPFHRTIGHGSGSVRVKFLLIQEFSPIKVKAYSSQSSVYRRLL